MGQSGRRVLSRLDVWITGFLLGGAIGLVVGAGLSAPDNTYTAFPELLQVDEPEPTGLAKEPSLRYANRTTELREDGTASGDVVDLRTGAIVGRYRLNFNGSCPR